MLETHPDHEWVKIQIQKIPHKLSFRIGEVSKLLDVKPYVLRYWESEFEQLQPKKLDNKQRLYFHKDVELLFLIKKLLYEDGFSIRGAKQTLKPLNKELQKESKKIKEQSQFKEKMLGEMDLLLDRTSKLKKMFSE